MRTVKSAWASERVDESNLKLHRASNYLASTRWVGEVGASYPSICLPYLQRLQSRTTNVTRVAIIRPNYSTRISPVKKKASII